MLSRLLSLPSEALDAKARFVLAAFVIGGRVPERGGLSRGELLAALGVPSGELGVALDELMAASVLYERAVPAPQKGARSTKVYDIHPDLYLRRRIDSLVSGARHSQGRHPDFCRRLLQGPIFAAKPDDIVEPLPERTEVVVKGEGVAQSAIETQRTTLLTRSNRLLLAVLWDNADSFGEVKGLEKIRILVIKSYNSCIKHVVE